MMPRMKFIPKGPLIPSELLIARDQGRVVFFCGAGVSYARAKLPNFYQLAQKACDALGVPDSSPARKLLTHVPKLERKIGTLGLVSMDRVFGLLEREFDSRSIDKVVAESLRPSSGVDLSAHQILLQLATTPEKRVQLVTTNFDRLFTDCLSTPEPWVAPKFPNLSIHEELNGVVYLHGRVTKGYDGAESGFVLSSSGFGRAYLSDGWATEFFKAILSKYLVVFIGYSADDPPISYLLEALNTTPDLSKRIYAFQSGSQESDLVKWKQKGVIPISYNSKNSHIYLWDTLAAWSNRAKDIGSWYDSVIVKAQKSPGRLAPYERGQVAHVISSTEGARKFANSIPIPPAEWLIVFDANCRYGAPGRTAPSILKGKIVDPFKRYHLDSDDRMPAGDPPFDRFNWLKFNAWDGLKINESDWLDINADNLPKLTGYYPINQPKLPPRLEVLGDWLVRVSDQPAAIWWAAKQNELHPNVLQRIHWELPKITTPNSQLARKAWKYLAEVWKNHGRDFISEWHDLKPTIRKDGWNMWAVRKFAEVHKPYFKLKPHFHSPVPPRSLKKLDLRDILPLEVNHPSPPDEELQLPDDLLIPFCEALRKNLEHATLMEKEIGHYGWQTLAPIVPDKTVDDETHQRKRGLSGSMLFFVNFFERLASRDPEAAKREFSKWDTTDQIVFERLRIWAAGLDSLFSDQAAGEIILELNDAVFWQYQHQRDLLLTLAKRWNTLPLEIRKSIELRLLEGRKKWHDNEENFEESNAWGRLNRLTWLFNQGCQYSFDLTTAINELQQIVPEWKAKYADSAAESNEPRAGIVKIENDYAILLTVPLDEILTKAEEIYKERDNFLVRKDPFLGLCTERPVRALMALNRATQQREFPKWAWRTFFNLEARKNDPVKLSVLIARRLLTYSAENLSIIANEITWWLSNVSGILGKRWPELLNDLFTKFIGIIKSDVSLTQSTILRAPGERDRWMEAYNSPVGHISDALINASINPDNSFSEKWGSHINSLLADGSPTRKYALSCFSRHLSWLYTYSPDWAESVIIPALLSRDEDEYHAAWDGLLSSGKILGERIYARLTPQILSLAVTNKQAHHTEILANIVLKGWVWINSTTGSSFISDSELRDILLNTSEQFREDILLQIKYWLGDKETGKTPRWYTLIPKFLGEIWPKQKYMRNEKVTSILCDIAFADEERFPEIVENVLPHMTCISKQYLPYYKVLSRDKSVVDRYPERTLTLIFTVLTEDARNWPYGIDRILSRIEQADSTLAGDSRLVELKRRWNAR